MKEVRRDVVEVGVGVGVRGLDEGVSGSARSPGEIW